MEPVIRFCANEGGQRIAYTSMGEGQALVFVSPWLSHQEQMWHAPDFRRPFEVLTKYNTVVSYDKVGTGLSDRNRTDFSLDSCVRELESVIDHLQLERLLLFGWSYAGPVAIAYAARHPEKVSQMILYSTYASGHFLGVEKIQASTISMVRAHWGVASKMIADWFTPGDAQASERLAKFMRESASGDMAADLLEASYSWDVSGILPNIRVPTLIFHHRGDRTVPFSAGRELAALIPDARFVPIEGNNSSIFWGDNLETILTNSMEFTGFTGDPALIIQSLKPQLTSDLATTVAESRKPGKAPANKHEHDVFISFAHPDKHAAAKIYSYLKSNGMNPFWCEELAAGQDYPQLLGEAIRDSNAFLLVVSDFADNSDSVRKETTIAHNNKKPIIPVRISNMMPKKIEYLIANSLFFDAFPLPIEQYLPKLTNDIKTIMCSEADKLEPAIPEFQIGQDQRVASLSLVADPVPEQKKVSWLRLDHPLVYIIATVLASVIAGIILTLFKC